MALDRQHTEELNMLQSILLAVLLATASLIIDPLIVKAILVLLAIVVLMGGTVRGQRE